MKEIISTNILVLFCLLSSTTVLSQKLEYNDNSILAINWGRYDKSYPIAIIYNDTLVKPPSFYEPGQTYYPDKTTYERFKHELNKNMSNFKLLLGGKLVTHDDIFKDPTYKYFFRKPLLASNKEINSSVESFRREPSSKDIILFKNLLNSDDRINTINKSKLLVKYSFDCIALQQNEDYSFIAQVRIEELKYTALLLFENINGLFNKHMLFESFGNEFSYSEKFLGIYDIDNDNVFEIITLYDDTIDWKEFRIYKKEEAWVKIFPDNYVN